MYVHIGKVFIFETRQNNIGARGVAKITAPGGLPRAITTGDGLVMNYPAVASPSPIYIPLWQRESYARCSIFFWHVDRFEGAGFY